MPIGRHVFILMALLAGVPSLSHSAGLSLNLQMPEVSTGTQFNFGATITKTPLGDGLVYTGPFTLHVTLPEGMSMISGGGGNWSCNVQLPDSRGIVCVSTGTLSDPVWGLNFLSLKGYTNIDMPLGPTTISATLSSPDFPLPPSPACVPSPSTSGCATISPAVAESSIVITGWGNNGIPVSTWPAVLEANSTQNSLVVDVRNFGFGASNTPVTLKIKFPQGATFASASGLPSWACSAQMEADGELLTCTVPAMFPDQSGYLTFRVNLAADIAVPGPLYFHAAIGNNVVPPPTTCVGDPAQRGCGRLAVNTRAPSAAFLRFSDPDVEHAPAYFTVGQDNGPILVHFSNIGDGLAMNTALQIKLPRGFAYTQNHTSLPAMVCTSSGTLADGPLLTCQGAGLPPGTSGYISFGVHLDPTLTERPGPVPMVGAIDTSNPANTTLLAACASDPNQINCFWHEIPTFAPCALQHGMDGIYCDGFERLDVPSHLQSITTTPAAVWPSTTTSGIPVIPAEAGI